jgi:hypothetical protein
MPTYEVHGGKIYRMSDGAIIPPDPENADFKDFISRGGKYTTSASPINVIVTQPSTQASDASSLTSSAASLMAIINRAKAVRARLDKAVQEFNDKVNKLEDHASRLEELTKSLDVG